MEDLKQKYELLYSKLDPKKQVKLEELVNKWLPTFRQELNTIINEKPNLEIVQQPELIPCEAGIAQSKMSMKTYIKNLKTGDVLLFNIGFNNYKNKNESDRVPFIKNWLERSLAPPKAQKAIKPLCERFNKMLTDFDNGFGLDKHLDTLKEVNQLIPHMKNVIICKGQPTVYDWFYNTKISRKELCSLIQETNDRLAQK
ncbi:hypothetical protein RYG35_001604 [Vibrio parahaemolyticus]|uniref:hypothetical protein n=1 Tax=Vibrio parahaemolyticus TaxID=670 RepID=UPI00280A2325|nr:hypothetical protein [Vibrio parahaemolyticus]ELM4049848.1 hypothetical protein [Vibrio parahaemolyticus]